MSTCACCLFRIPRLSSEAVRTLGNRYIKQPLGSLSVTDSNTDTRQASQECLRSPSEPLAGIVRAQPGEGEQERDSESD